MGKKREVKQPVNVESPVALEEKAKGEITSYKNLLSLFKLTPKQKELMKVIEDNHVIILGGPAGTGKTIVTCYYAIKSLAERKYDTIICTKPIMEAGEKLGALPGTVEDKINPYYESYNQNFIKLIKKLNITKLIEKKTIDYKPISYMRGVTYDNACLLLDEAQNLDAKSLILFVTRMGKGSKVIISGDVSQSDIKDEQLARLIKGVPGVAVFNFNEDDIMRNDILIEITKKYEEAKKIGDLPKNRYNS